MEYEIDNELDNNGIDKITKKDMDDSVNQLLAENIKPLRSECSDLLPCPFCGEEESIGLLTTLSVTHGRFGCERCGGSIVYYRYSTFEERNRKWNTRAR